MKIDSPVVSIITSVLNDKENISKAINSVRNQDYPKIQYIIIDGGSTDGTIDVIRQNTDVIDFWISEKDTGVYSAWNKGLRFALGEWICFLGADDELNINSISKMIEAYRIVNAPIEYISGLTDLYINGRYFKTSGEAFKWDKFKKYLCTGHNASLHHRSLYDKHGFYNEDFRSAGDYEFLLRSGPNLKALHVDYITSRMHLGGVSNNSTKPIIEAHMARKLNHANNLITEVVLVLKGYISFFLNRMIRDFHRK
jgi:glycosyltransferase involved in cell wall biosynthesis